MLLDWDEGKASIHCSMGIYAGQGLQCEADVYSCIIKGGTAYGFCLGRVDGSSRS